MITNITAQDILLAHISICHTLGYPAELEDAGTLREIENQLKGNLSWLSPEQKAAYIGMQIAKLRPFKYANKATAAAVSMAVMGESISMAPRQVAEVLESSTVVDEVADQLVLAGGR